MKIIKNIADNMCDLKLYNISIYTEFDGLITDKHFVDYFIQVFNTNNFNLNLLNIENIDYIKEKYYIDSNFKVFAEYCRNLNIELSIVSDGFVELIEPAMKKIKLNNIDIYANSLINISDNYNSIFVYGADESCECKNNTDNYISEQFDSFTLNNKSCKRNLILSNTKPDNIIIYIGDGYYDTCMAEYSDIIFAKQKLSAYCNKKRIPHYNFKNYFDIYRIFKDIIENKKYKIRHQAFLNRKRAFEYE